MGATEHGNRHERRRFITRAHVEDAAAAGQPVHVRGRDVLTDEAAQRATDLGVRIEREGGRAARAQAGASATASRAGPTTTATPSPADVRRAVRAAVIAELGTEPPGLDAAIERVMKRMS